MVLTMVIVFVAKITSIFLLTLAVIRYLVCKFHHLCIMLSLKLKCSEVDYLVFYCLTTSRKCVYLMVYVDSSH